MSSGSDRDPPAGAVRDDANFDALRTADNVVRVDSPDAEAPHAKAADGDVDEQDGDDAFVTGASLSSQSLRKDNQRMIDAGSVAKEDPVNLKTPTERHSSVKDVKHFEEPGPLQGATVTRKRGR